MPIEYSDSFRKAIETYYRKIYKGLALNDFDKRAKARLKEDEVEAERCDWLENALLLRMKDFKAHLVVGAGTGGLMVALRDRGARDLFACEPCPEALQIAREKAHLAGIEVANVTDDVVEHLPYCDCSMDFIHCFTVLEHVQDVRKAIKEMYRVLRPGGLIYIHTPDYRFPYEGHYKTFVPVFLGKRFSIAYLKMKGKPVDFMKGVNFVTEKSLDRLLRREVDLYFRIYMKMPDEWSFERQSNIKDRLLRGFHRLFYLRFSIPPNQMVVIRKTGKVSK
ncbi:class I SAM-dependent methyltransferase [Candidatus Omnitrophota bacterium]